MSLSVQKRVRESDEVFPDDEVKIILRLGPGHQTPREVEMTAAQFEAAVKVANNGAAIVYGD